MTSPLSLVARQARLLALRGFLDGGGGMQVYTGTVPATPETEPVGTLLGTVALANPVGVTGFSANLATLTITCPQVGVAVDTGVVGWVRFMSATAGVLDLAAGTTGTPAIFSSAQIIVGGELQLLSCVLSE